VTESSLFSRAETAVDTRNTVIDFTHLETPQPSRWDRGDGQSAITALDSALERAGLPGRLEASKRLLERAEVLAAQAREAKLAARHKLGEANRTLLADGPVDTAAYGAVLVELAPWLDEESAGMLGVMQACHQVRGNATQTTFAMAPGLYADLADVCRGIVAECAAVPSLPREVWSATSGGEAAALAVRANREADFARLTRCGDKWDAVHAAAALLRETGVFQGELLFAGPVSVCTQFRNWSAALEGLLQVRRMPGPLRLRAAIDRDWLPGLYLATDAAVEGKPERKVTAEPVAVAAEFA
jgi:hypothetical protein